MVFDAASSSRDRAGSPKQMDIDQLKKFVLLLGSSQDGEVLAALRKLRAALKQAGTDLHFIADGLGSAEEVDRARRAAAAARAELADFRRKSDQFLKATLGEMEALQERLEVAEKAARSRKETETELRGEIEALRKRLEAAEANQYTEVTPTPKTVDRVWVIGFALPVVVVVIFLVLLNSSQMQVMRNWLQLMTERGYNVARRLTVRAQKNRPPMVKGRFDLG